MNRALRIGTIVGVLLHARDALACGTCGPVSSSGEGIVLATMIAAPFAIGLACALKLRGLLRRQQAGLEGVDDA